MKERKKFGLALEDIKRLASDPDFPDRDQAMYASTQNFLRFTEEISVDPRKARDVVDVLAQLRGGTGKGIQNGEERMMNCLESIANHCAGQMEDAKTPISECPSEAQIPASVQMEYTVLRILCAYAMNCLKFKRVRDSLGARRRALAFNILGQASGYLDLSDAIAIAERTCSSERIDGRAAAGFLGLHDEILSGEDLRPSSGE